MVSMLFSLQGFSPYVFKFPIPPFCNVKNPETPLSTHLQFQMREQRNVVLKTIEEECKSLIKEG